MFAATSCGAFGQSSTTTDESSVAETTPTTSDTWCYDVDEHARRAVEELSSFLVDPLSLTIYDIYDYVSGLADASGDDIADVVYDASGFNSVTIDYGARDRHGTLGRYTASVYVGYGHDEGRCYVNPTVWALSVGEDSEDNVEGHEVRKGDWPTTSTTVDPRHPFEICDVDGRSGFTAREVACLHRHGIDID